MREGGGMALTLLKTLGIGPQGFNATLADKPKASNLRGVPFGG